jgi:hypothetical protein
VSIPGPAAARTAAKLGPIVTRVDVGLFDRHTWLDGIVNPNKVREPVRAFLLAKDGYQQLHASGTWFRGDNFDIGAPWRHFHHNHFWSDYLRAVLTSDDVQDRWLLQVPFMCRPRDFGVGYLDADGGAGKSVQVKPTVWLWPFGWSVNLSFVLRGPRSLEDVRDTVARLDRDPCLRITGEANPLKVTGVLAALTSRMRAELGGGNDVKASHMGGFSRVVSLTRFQDREQCWTYTGEPGTVCGTLPFADRARLHAAFMGRDVASAELTDWEGTLLSNGTVVDRKFTITPLRDAGFAITYLGKGTLLFLSEVDQREPERRERCLAANVRATSMAIEALYAVARAPRPTVARSAALAEVRDLAAASLAELPDRYLNRFCRRMFEVRKDLRKLREQVLGVGGQEDEEEKEKKEEGGGAAGDE